MPREQEEQEEEEHERRFWVFWVVDSVWKNLRRREEASVTRVAAAALKHQETRRKNACECVCVSGGKGG